jgi:acyl-CoA thioesterase FadM
VPDGAISLPTRVRPQDIDPMGHVNNAAYLDYLEEAVLAAGSDGAKAIAAVPRRILVEYVAAAPPGAMLAGTAWRIEVADGGGWAWRLADETGRELAKARITADGGAGT